MTTAPDTISMVGEENPALQWIKIIEIKRNDCSYIKNRIYWILWLKSLCLFRLYDKFYSILLYWKTLYAVSKSTHSKNITIFHKHCTEYILCFTTCTAWHVPCPFRICFCGRFDSGLCCSSVYHCVTFLI